MSSSDTPVVSPVTTPVIPPPTLREAELELLVASTAMLHEVFARVEGSNYVSNIPTATRNRLALAIDGMRRALSAT